MTKFQDLIDKNMWGSRIVKNTEMLISVQKWRKYYEIVKTSGRWSIGCSDGTVYDSVRRKPERKTEQQWEQCVE